VVDNPGENGANGNQEVISMILMFFVEYFIKRLFFNAFLGPR